MREREERIARKAHTRMYVCPPLIYIFVPLALLEQYMSPQIPFVFAIFSLLTLSAIAQPDDELQPIHQLLVLCLPGRDITCRLDLAITAGPPGKCSNLPTQTKHIVVIRNIRRDTLEIWKHKGLFGAK